MKKQIRSSEYAIAPWKIAPLAITHLVIAFLLMSWLFPATRVFWDAFDKATFLWLNSFLQDSPLTQGFWSIASHKRVDWAHDIVFLSFFIYFIIKAPKQDSLKKVAELFFSILVIAFVISFVNKTIFPKILHAERVSPSGMISEAIRLSKEVSWIHVKDISTNSYPGDHGTTAVLFTFLAFYFGGYRAGTLGTLYAIFFCLPRLIAGAHWPTDILLGSVPIAVISLSWICFSPLQSLITKGIHSLLYRINNKNKESPHEVL